MARSHINITKRSWKPCGPDDDPTARLHTAIRINGQPFHLYAVAVMKDDQALQSAEHPACNRDVEAIYELGEPGEPYETTKIGKRDYIIGMCPFC
jgi:hypothetical protein